MCEDSGGADTARRRSSLSKVGYEWRSGSSELLWVAVKRSTGNDLRQLHLTGAFTIAEPLDGQPRQFESFLKRDMLIPARNQACFAADET